MSSDRFKARIAVTFLARNQNSALLTDYVSHRGIFVRTDSPPAVMELLRMELMLPPTSTVIVLHGMVTELVATQTKNSAPGAEILFFAKAGEVSRHWDDFIQYLRESHPESRVNPVVLSPGATDQIRRAHPRQVPGTPIRIESTHSSESLVVGDISNGGMFIRTEQVFAVGAELRITLMDPRSPAKFPLECVVRRRAFGSDAGIGIEFLNMDDARRARLSSFLRDADAEPVQAHCQEVISSRFPRMMRTLQGPGSFGLVSEPPPEGSWAVDDGWPT